MQLVALALVRASFDLLTYFDEKPNQSLTLKPAFRVLKESDGDLGNNICSLPEVCALCDVGLGQKIVNQPSPNIIAPDEMRRETRQTCKILDLN